MEQPHVQQLEVIKCCIEDDVFIIKLDTPDSKVNSLNENIMVEVEAGMEKVRQDPTIRSIVVMSGKPDTFIVGADIKMLQKCKTAQEAENLSQRGQALLQLIEDFPKPIVVAIHGQCLGGGLEMTLACHYRIAVAHKKTLLGLPEVMLGLLPGLGGTQRLPRLLMLQDALDLMLSGRKTSAKSAHSLGLVDQLIDPLETDEATHAHLEKEAIRLAKALADGSLVPNRTRPFMQRLIQYALSYEIIRNMLLKKARAKVMKFTCGLYPAPLKILDVVQKGLFYGNDAGYKAESVAFGDLAMTKESKALFSLYNGQNILKKNRFGDPTREVKNVGIVGNGVMAAGIAQVYLENNYNVFMKGRSMDNLKAVLAKLSANFDEAIKRMKMTKEEKDLILGNMHISTDYSSLCACDVVIETIAEDLDNKKVVLQKCEEVLPAHCIYATNTSTLSISQLAAVSQRPDKIVGMHYFLPAEKMKLLEVVATDWTSTDTQATVVNLGIKQGKTVIIVKDTPGFYTSRLVTALIHETFKLLLEYRDAMKVNTLSRQLGFPVGLLTLADEIGIDVGVCAERNTRIVSIRQETENVIQFTMDLEANGYLGRKSGSGFFDYTNGKNGEPNINPGLSTLLEKHKMTPIIGLTDEDLKFRMLLRFVNEAALCLESGILSSPVDGDIGAVFGIGFPPFLGGPFRWVDSYGADKVVAKLREFENIFGKSFTPCQLLVDHANDPSKTFHKY